MSLPPCRTCPSNCNIVCNIVFEAFRKVPTIRVRRLALSAQHSLAVSPSGWKSRTVPVSQCPGVSRGHDGAVRHSDGWTSSSHFRDRPRKMHGGYSTGTTEPHAKRH